MESMLSALKIICDKSLADLLAAAEKELNGTAYETFRVANGPRMILIVCISGEYELAKIQKAIPATINAPMVDPAANLGRLFFNTKEAGGFACFTCPAKAGKALVLISAEPRSMMNLELALGLT